MTCADDDPTPDVLSMSRGELLHTNLIHEFDLARIKANLSGCYGALMRRRYAKMLNLIQGKRVLDCGCGFGQFSRIALDAGFEVTSVDIDESSINIAREQFDIPCRKESAYATSLRDGGCDTVVCCDSIQHLEIDHLAREIIRIGASRVIIYDSNIENPLLRWYRTVSGHEESNDRSAFKIIEEFEEVGFKKISLRFENYVALPISGGFQRRPIPLLSRFTRSVAALDRMLAAVGSVLGFDKRMAFRFELVLQRN